MDRPSRSLASSIRRLWAWARRHWIISTVGVAAAIGVGIWLIFFYFAVHLLWVDEEVDEALPTFGSPAAPAEAPAPAPADDPVAPPPAGSASDDPAAPAPAPAPAGEPAAEPAGDGPASAPVPADGAAPPPAAAADEVPAAVDDTVTAAPAPAAPAPAPAEPAPPPAGGPMAAGPGASGMPGDEITQERADAMNEAMASGAMPREVVMDEERPMPVAPQIVTLVSGEFISRSHHTEGRALVLNDGSEQRFLRFENFRTDNGPDVDVWLSPAPPDAPAGDFLADWVDLGDLKGNVGAQNYEIPPSVDLDHYSTVVVWCVRFSVAFGTAALA